jgi:hypothetical protein
VRRPQQDRDGAERQCSVRLQFREFSSAWIFRLFQQNPPIAEVQAQGRACALLGPHRNGSLTAQHAAGVGKGDKDTVDAGHVGDRALPVTKMPKVGVALGEMSVETVAAVAVRQLPLVGSVWQTSSVTGRLAAPVLAAAVVVGSVV